MKSKVIFITAFHSFITKNILNTDVFRILHSKPNIHIILLVPESKKNFFETEYRFPNVEIVSVPVPSLITQAPVRKYSYVSHLLMNSHYLWYKKVERLHQHKNIRAYIKYYGEVLFTEIFSRLKIVRSIFRRYFLKKVSIPAIQKIFDTYNPDVLFSTDAFDETDILFAREAKVRNTPIISMVRSWDNCRSKGILRVLPNVLVVNTKTLKEEAITYHDMPADKIFIGGLPQFDAFVKEKRTDRQSFFKSINADQDKKLILFAPAGSILSDTDWQIADIIEKALHDGKIQYPVQVFVRNHPNHPADFSRFSHRGDFIFETPGKVFNEKNPKETELTQTDTKHLGDLLCYCDVVIYVATTLGIDSLLFDKPQIIIDFDGYDKKPYTKSVARYHDEDHMQKMLALGGVTVAKSAEDLIDAINLYLENPLRHHDERQLIIEQQLYMLDGNSGERIGQYVSDSIDQLTNDN